MERIDLSTRVAIVAAAASGIGRAIAEDLASHGAQVLSADLDPAGEQVAATLSGRSLLQRCDVSSRDDCRASVERYIAEFGRVDTWDHSTT